jgi:DNA polymerase III, subunit gamma and tau
MGKALYRKYRSRKLSEVVGQNHITDILSSALKQDKISHAYLFTGPRGVGKTSVARIMAHEINGFDYSDEESNLDIIEIDAASNNGVDDIRSLRERVAITPIKGKKKIYIIDEVHMLSKAAFNALLKTLEEPPEHVVFIMATTDAHKLPATIISRSQQFTFRLASTDDIMGHLKYIAKEEKITINDEALRVITKKGGGSFRDSISLLDQISNMSVGEEITGDMVERALGIASDEIVETIIRGYREADLKNVVAKLHSMNEIGVKPDVVADQIIRRVVDNIEENSDLLSLVDKLTEVSRASYPDIRLLTALSSSFDKPERTKNIASSVTVVEPEIVVSVKPKREAKPKTETESKDKQTVESTVKKRKTKGLEEFKWENVLAEIKNKSMLLHSSLEKCSFVVKDDTLKIYEKNKIAYKKLNSASFKELINAELEKTTLGALEIEIIAGDAPIQDELTASVADIMGGGEEIKVDE